MDQDAEVANLLRDFVKQDGDRSRDADGNTYEITRSDDQTVYKIMYGISD